MIPVSLLWNREKNIPHHAGLNYVYSQLTNIKTPLTRSVSLITPLGPYLKKRSYLQSFPKIGQTWPNQTKLQYKPLNSYYCTVYAKWGIWSQCAWLYMHLIELHLPLSTPFAIFKNIFLEYFTGTLVFPFSTYWQPYWSHWDVLFLSTLLSEALKLLSLPLQGDNWLRIKCFGILCIFTVEVPSEVLKPRSLSLQGGNWLRIKCHP